MCKIYLSGIRHLTLLLIILSQTNLYATQLNGSYTINPSLSASTSNFKDFHSAITFMQGAGSRSDGGPSNSSPFGISGPVEFNISASTYYGKVNITGNIDGTSPANTITFDGINATSRIISSSDSIVFRLDNVKYVCLRNLTFQATGPYWSWGVLLKGNATACKIKNCIIELTSGASTPTISTFAGIMIQTNSASASGIKSDSLEIDSNLINYGNYGISCSGSSSATGLDNKIRNNTICNAYAYGVYTAYQQGAEISGNRIIMLHTNFMSFAGIYCNQLTSTGTRSTSIKNNRITSIGQTGIHINASSNPGGAKGLILNNMIGGGVRNKNSVLLNMASSNNWSVTNNSIYFDSAQVGGVGSPVNIISCTGIAVINNILTLKNDIYGVALFANPASSIDTMDYNIFYKGDITSPWSQLLKLGSTNYYNANFIGALGFNVHSSCIKPVFINDTNLHVLNACNKGIPLPYLIEDCDRDPRPNPPMIGADETSPITNNISPIAVMQPTGPVTAGLQNLVVMVQNQGSNTISSFSISYCLNANPVITQSWSGTLYPCDTVSVIFTGSNQVYIGNSNNFTIYTSDPNTTVDNNPDNDTLRIILNPALNGSYTIGPTGADYSSFADAINALHSTGVSGPVTFNVMPATYNEQVNITPPIVGISASSPVIFDGIDKITRIIHYSGYRHALKIESLQFITIKNLTIRASNIDTAFGIMITGINPSNNKIKNCVIDLPNMAGNTYQNKSGGIIINASADLSFNVGGVAKVDSLEIDSNTFNYGFFGVVNRGPLNVYSYNNKYRNNIFNNIYCWGIFMMYHNNIKIQNNTITTWPTHFNSSGIYLDRINGIAPSNIEVSGNRISIFGHYGVYLNFCNNSASAKGIFANNMVGSGNNQMSSGGIIPVSFEAGSNWDIIHNSIHNNRVAASSDKSGAALYISATPGTSIYNNILSVSKTSPGLPLYLETGLTPNGMDNNIFYRADCSDGGFVHVLGTTYDTSNFKGAAGFNYNSKFLNPQFVNDTNLHVNDKCNNGQYFPAYSTDIDGQVRNNPPNIGADEVLEPPRDLRLVSLLSPSFPVSIGAQPLRVLVSNQGSDTISSFTLSYFLNGSPVAISQAWSGNLLSCDTVSVTLAGANQLNLSGGINTLKVFTSSPNGSNDANLFNDTINYQLATPMNGTYVIGNTPSDYTSFTDAVNALILRGVDGAVRFEVKTGTYSESISIPPINGASQNNPVWFTSMASNADSVSLNWASSSVLINQYVLGYLGGSAVSFKHITFNQLNQGWPNISAIFYVGSSSFDTIENCKLNVPIWVQPQTTNNDNYVVGVYQANGTGLAWKNNIFNGAKTSFLVRGNYFDYVKRIFMDGNTFQNSYQGPGGIANTKWTKFMHNTVNLLSVSGSQSGAISWSYCDSALTIIGNRFNFYIPGSITILQSRNSLSQKGIFANNIITDTVIGTRAFRHNLFVGSESINAGIYHNSFRVAGGGGIEIIAPNSEVKNNLFSDDGNVDACVVNYGGDFDMDYNNYYAKNTTKLINIIATTYPNITARKNASSGHDLNSLSYMPKFINRYTLEPDPNDSSCWALNGRATYIPGVPELAFDINGNPRPTNASQGVPDIGAYEFTPLVDPPFAKAYPVNPIAGTTQHFIFGEDTIARINWPTSSTVPATIGMKNFSGERPSGTYNGASYMRSSWKIDPVASALYNYDITLRFKDPWIGTCANETNLRMARNIDTFNTGWVVSASTTVDTVRNYLRVNGLNDFGTWYTATNANNPLPVKLLDISAHKVKKDVIVNWTTASEINSGWFEIERVETGNASNQKNWKRIGKVAAAGNSNSLRNYLFTDAEIAGEAVQRTLYYRLKMIDKDGIFDYSKTVSVDLNNETGELLQVYPNPFSDHLYLGVFTNHPSEIKLFLYDINGKEISISNTITQQGINNFEIYDFANLEQGIYFLRIVLADESKIIKLIKVK